jgi:hypothetical protein
VLIVTAANSIEDSWGDCPNFSFKSVIRETVRRAEQFGYRTAVYDLGSLGMGEPFFVASPSFQEHGYFEEIQKGYRSRSLFKPDLLIHSLRQHGDNTVYLDADALLFNRIDEVFGGDFDVGVTLRRKSEMKGDWYESHYEIVKFINAGVIFLSPTDATSAFLERWKTETERVGNDQRALNAVTCLDDPPAPYSIVTIDGVRIKYFPTMRYNYYYFDQGFPLIRKVKILHFKGEVRKYYPFTFRNRAYCALISPVLHHGSRVVPPKVRALVKKAGRSRGGR